MVNLYTTNQLARSRVRREAARLRRLSCFSFCDRWRAEPAADCPLGQPLASRRARTRVGGQHGGQQCDEFDASKVHWRERSLLRRRSRLAIALGVNRSTLIANKSGNSLTELNATSGSLERVVEGSTYGSLTDWSRFLRTYLWVVARATR